MAADSDHAARPYGEFGPQGTVRVRDAGAVCRPGGTRAGVRPLSRRKKPQPRAMGAGVAALPESPAARSAGTAERAAGTGPVAGDSEDRRHLLPKTVDGCHAEQPAITRGGGYGQAVSGSAS